MGAPLGLAAPSLLGRGLGFRFLLIRAHVKPPDKTTRFVLLLCVLQVCMLSTPNHIAWMVPLLPASYFAPT
jgi:hypothetical protein